MAESRVVMSRSGFCAFPSTRHHTGCVYPTCTCNCHESENR